MSIDLLYLPEFWWAVLRGLGITVFLTITTMALGLLVGTGIALLRLYATWPLRWFAIVYVFIFRGVPLLVLLFFFYYGAPRIPGIQQTFFWDLIFASALSTAVFALTLNNGGYLAEIIRGGILTVPRGLIEAGEAIGMTPVRVFFRITLPVGFRNIVASLGNETIAVIKASAITSIITIRDLLGGPVVVGKIYLDQFTPLLVAAVFYFALVQIVEFATQRLIAGLAVGNGDRKAL
ncbi:amino acid ABC transporter permease [Mesorhizobium sp. M1312]|uniref:amino acid ABC transporter permease n=1 Tax=unclassified Mesorhizobium TaxID=325217 RepID=UPI00333658AD